MLYFDATILRTFFGATKTGTQYIKFVLDLIPNNKEGIFPDGVEKRQFGELWLTDKAIARTKETLRELGWDGRCMTDLEVYNPLQNVACRVACEWEQYNGEDKFRVRFINAPGNGRKPKCPEELKPFQQWDKYFADGNDSPPPVPPPEPVPLPEPPAPAAAPNPRAITYAPPAPAPVRPQKTEGPWLCKRCNIQVESGPTCPQCGGENDGLPF